MTENSRPREGETRSEYVRRRREEASPFDLERNRAQRACNHAEHGSETVAFRKANGDLVAYEQCKSCGGRYDEYKVHARSVIPNPETLPLVRDEIYSRPPCEVCGAFGTEIHHWAPKEFFGWEADHWPTAYLCRDCHTRWHATMRTAVPYKTRQQQNIENARPVAGPIRHQPRQLGTVKGAT